MARVSIPDERIELTEFGAVKEFLATIGIGYERWDTSHDLSASVAAEQILQTYAAEIETLKESGGYRTADVIDVKPDTPNLQVMLDKFNREHWHDEDEVRFIIEGHGVFHINPRTGPVVAIEVGKGDLLRVPAGTYHWFDLCGDRRIRAIRLFQDQSGWTPRYSESGLDKGYMPVCFGLAFIPSQLQQL
jgi:1,2-dihydroxy-3-keto-5-methylthiopentene dioxygenase